MFYRIVDKKLYDYSDIYYENSEYTDIITEQEYREHPNKVIIQENQEEIQIPIYNDEGEIIGYETKIVYTYELILNPDWNTIQIKELRETKNKENDTGANSVLPKEFTINVGLEPCHFIFNKNTQDDLNSAAIGFLAGTIEQKQWTDEQGKTVQLSPEDVANILLTFDAFANQVWELWGEYKEAIDAAETLSELNNIVIDYSQFIDDEEN